MQHTAKEPVCSLYVEPPSVTQHILHQTRTLHYVKVTAKYKDSMNEMLLNYLVILEF